MNRFRVHALIADDLDTTIVRIEASQMQQLGIKEGDTVKVSGTKSTGAVCYSVEDGFRLSNDSEINYLSESAPVLPQLRPSNIVAENMADHSGAGLIPAKLVKMHDGTVPASRVSLMPLHSGADTSQFDKSRLNRAIVCKNNRFSFRDYDPKRNFGFIVSRVEPADYTQITKETTVEFVPIQPDVIHSSFGNKLETLQKVVPIVYQETLQNVTVTIPSIEMFDSGFRFYVYLKGDFTNENKIPNGHASVITTMHDDAQNTYSLYGKAGGGTHSPDGFDLRYEYRGKPLSPNTKRFTINIEEIIIQEQFPSPDMSHTLKRNRMMRGTKEDYSKIEKFPSFYIISGPWKAEFSIN